MRRAPSLHLVLLLALAGAPARAQVPGTPPASVPAPLAESLKPEARAAYGTGVVLYRKKDYANALPQFRAAFTMDPDGRLLWNMAVCEKNLSRFAEAHELTERYLAAGSALSDAEHREAVTFASSLRGFIALTTVESSPPGASLWIDDEDRGRTPLTLRVDAGPHAVRLLLAGRKEVRSTERFEGGSEPVLRFSLDPEDARVTVMARTTNAVSIDGSPVGRTPWFGRVTPGAHTFLVTANDHRPRTFALTLAPGEARTIDGELEPERRGSAWPWIAGGVVVAAALAVGGYFLFRPSDPALPPVGSLGSHTLQ